LSREPKANKAEVIQKTKKKKHKPKTGGGGDGYFSNPNTVKRGEKTTQVTRNRGEKKMEKNEMRNERTKSSA